MSSQNFQVRRAVIDDLPALLALWRDMKFPAEELERRFAEFQIATDGQGRLLGAIALTMASQQGWIRHEAFTDFGFAEQLRGMFWARLQNLATNHGLQRLWTQENAPFWRQHDFQSADVGALEKLPAEWRNAEGGWFTLQLRAEVAMQALAAAGDVESLMKLEREQTQKTLAQADSLRKFALLIAVLLAMVVGVLIIYLIKRDPSALQHFFRSNE